MITFALAAAIIFNCANLFTVSAKTNDLLNEAVSNIETESVSATFTVNSAADTSDGACTTSAGGCTLREAIIAANNNAGADTIQFAIGAAPVINVGSTGLGALPQITETIIINGNTGGASFVQLNGAGAGAGAHGLYITGGGSIVSKLIINRFSGIGIRFETGGSNLVANCLIGTNIADAPGIGNATGILIINSANNTIGGGDNFSQVNVISGNNVDGLRIDGASSTGNIVQGNYIGVTGNGQADLGNTLNGVVIINANANIIGSSEDHFGDGNIISGNNQNGVAITGNSSDNALGNNIIGFNSTFTAPVPNGNDGVFILNGAKNNLIGYADHRHSNFISGNAFDGVRIDGATTTGNEVYGNQIGTTSSNPAFGNGFNGVVISNAPNNFIGAGLAGDNLRGNRIIGNGKNGIGITGASATGNKIQGNSVGTSESAPAGNGQHGLFITGSASNNLIGGTGFVEGNDFKNNVGDGIYADSGTGNQFIGNQYVQNGGLGIDIGTDGVTANDALDADTGANNLQNFPVLTAAEYSNNLTTVIGTFNSKPNTAFIVEFFASGGCDASGNGEGGFAYNDKLTVTTDASGNASVNKTLSGTLGGQYITAAATDPAGNTSEISNCVFSALTNPTSLLFNAGSFTVNESGGNAVITVRRAGGFSDEVSVNYATSNGTATGGTDYTAASGRLTFYSGEINKIFVVPITNDNIHEPNETINLSLSNPTGGATLGSPSAAVLTIVDDDSVPSLSVTDTSLVEGNSGTINATFTATLSAASSQSISVNYATAGGTATAGTDYTATSNTLTFAPGETSKTVNVSVIGDTLVEPNETFNFNLSNATNATIADGQGIGTITNDDLGGAIQFSASTINITENSPTVLLTVTRNGGAASGISVDYATANGTAVAGQDYAASSGSLNFGANETSKTFTVPIINDTTVEGNETFTVNLTSPSGGATLGTPAGLVVTILDNDACTYSLSPVSQNFSANGGSGTVNITTPAACAWTTTNNAGSWITITGTASGSGNAAIGFTVSANASNSPRTGTLIIGGQTFTVTQTGTSVSNRKPFDFDGDGKTDISIFRPSVGEWWYLKSSTGGNAALQFGASSDKLAPGDFTGDGKTDIAFWRPSTGFWFILRSENGSFFSFPFGATGDIPAPADYDGDGKTDAAVFRPANSTWYILRSSDGVTTIGSFGASGDKPVPADYDGDGKADIAIWRPTVGEWWYSRSSTGQTAALQFGTSTDQPVPGDYTGDGKADIAFFRPSTGFWFILRSEDGSFFSFQFGTTGDVPAAGDYDGDGKTDATVFRPSSSTWYSNRTSAGVLIVTFGTLGDRPVPNAFIP
jgi:CSLREA domain-containing protein